MDQFLKEASVVPPPQYLRSSFLNKVSAILTSKTRTSSYIRKIKSLEPSNVYYYIWCNSLEISKNKTLV